MGWLDPTAYREKLQKLQNRAIRVITNSTNDTSSPDIFLTRLAGTIYRLEGLNKRLIQCTGALIISSQLISVICLPQEYRITIFATPRKN